jgi:uncharacterized protein (TIGR03067 family)
MRLPVLSLLFLAWAPSAVAAPAPLPRRAKADPHPLQGEWKETHEDGRAVSDPSQAITLQVRGRQMTFRWQGTRGMDELEAEFSVQPGPQPAPIDLRLVRRREGNDTTEEKERAQGLYQLRGDVLWLTLGRSDRPRGLDEKRADRFVFARVRR